MNMRENIAKLLASCDGMHPDAVSNDEDEMPIWTTYLDVADSVLEALMEPTQEMIEAGRWPAEDDGPLACFRAMIQAAREGK